jgi:hypothetical protein
MTTFSAVIDVLVSIAIPALAFGANWQIRSKKGYALSAAADFILAIASFDLAALAAHDVFEKTVRDPILREKFVPVFIILFVITMALWAFLFLPLEDKLERVYKITPDGSLTGDSALYFFGAWGSVVFIVAPHVLAFVYG